MSTPRAVVIAVVGGILLVCGMVLFDRLHSRWARRKAREETLAATKRRP